MLEEVKKLMVENLGIDADEITENTDFKKDLGVDSLDLFELVSEIEDTYGIEIAAEDLDGIDTVKELISYIERRKN